MTWRVSSGPPQVQPFEVDELGLSAACVSSTCNPTWVSTLWTWFGCTRRSTAAGLDFSARRSRRPPRLALRSSVSRTGSICARGGAGRGGRLGATAVRRRLHGKGCALLGARSPRTGPNSAPAFLRPGGLALRFEFHPVGSCLDEEAPVVSGDYFDSQAIEEVPRALTRTCGGDDSQPVIRVAAPSVTSVRGGSRAHLACASSTSGTTPSSG